MESTILIVDDEEAVRSFLSRSLQGDDYGTRTAGNGGEALRAFQEDPPDLVLLDLKLPDTDGLSVLKKMKEKQADLLVIMLTAYGAIDSAVEAMRLGAYDFVNKPFNMEALRMTIKKALETQTLKREVGEFRRQQMERFEYDFVIGQNAKMEEIYQLIDRVARSEDTSVLIEGESGTGKEVIANAIHYRSKRGKLPFMELNCAAIPEGLMESELFGHERGAFTDAKERKRGLIELADGGTLFLDEIAELPVPMQVKLLRVLENKRFPRVGGVRDIAVDVRVIAATNQDLAAAVEARAFREDLYYRLKVISIRLPPLRERREDILILAKSFISEFDKAMAKKVTGISAKAERLLLAYGWPGNIRELRNVIERAMILCSGPVIDQEHLPPEIFTGSVSTEGRLGSFSLTPKGVELEALKEQMERDLIVQALSMVKGNQVQAARLLHITRDVLRYRMRKYNLL
jgi:two-component system response regulator AtoC